MRLCDLPRAAPMAQAANRWTGFGRSGTARFADGRFRRAWAAFWAGLRGDCGAGRLCVDARLVEANAGQVSWTYFSHCTRACVEINQ